jgi:hypothetical protein
MLGKLELPELQEQLDQLDKQDHGERLGYLVQLALVDLKESKD